MPIEHVTVGIDGRLVIPASLRKEIGIRPVDTLVLESDGDSLLVRSFDQVLKETQDYFRRFVPAGTSVVDELIADRRVEAAREAGESPGRRSCPPPSSTPPRCWHSCSASRGPTASKSSGPGR